MNVLELRDVSIIYQNTKEAVKHVSFAVPEGKIVAIVGESGSGKSTLIRAAIGLLPAGGELASGQILFGEKDMAAMTAEELRHVRGEGMAMIFQNAGDYLNPRRKVCDQYVETLRCHQSMTKKQGYEIAKKMLATLKLPDTKHVMNAYPFQLSGGMKQRVAIAMAMSMHPKLLLADEPTSALDVTVQAQVLEQLNSLRAEFGTSLMIITHNLGIVARYADSVKIVYGGKIVEEGSVEQIFEDPYHPYTIGLISAVPRLDLPRSHGLHTIEGEPPDMSKIPPRSCAFAQRCSYCTEECRTHRPPLKQLGEGHACACFHMDEAHRGAEEVLQA